MTRYEIRVKGVLSPLWRPDFNEFEFAEVPCSNGLLCTVLTGAVIDQAALHGLLARIRDLGLELHSVRRLAAD